MAISFDNIIREFERTKKKLPVFIGNMAKNHFRNNFREQGFVDEGVQKWRARKRMNKTDRRKYNAAMKANNAGAITEKQYNTIRSNGGRAILVQTGHLKNSINVGVASFEKIEIGTYGITYGVYHNKGTEHLPQRKFMGTSHDLSKKISDRIHKEVRSVLEQKGKL